MGAPMRYQPQSKPRLDQSHPLARGLVFASVAGGADLISGTPAVKMGAGATSSFEQGKTLYTPGVTSDGWYWPLPPNHPLYTITTQDTMFVLARRVAGSSFNNLLGVPYRAGSWTSPYYAWNLGGQSDNTMGAYAFAVNGSARNSVNGPAGLFADNVTRPYGATRNGTRVRFYTGNAQYSQDYSITSGSPDWSNKQPLMLFNRSNTSPGEGMSAHAGLVLVWNRELSPAEWASLAQNPWQFFLDGYEEEEYPDTRTLSLLPGQGIARSQPQGLAKINSSNPLTRGLRAAYLATPSGQMFECVSGKFGTPTGSPGKTVNTAGVATTGGVSVGYSFPSTDDLNIVGPIAIVAVGNSYGPGSPNQVVVGKGASSSSNVPFCFVVDNSTSKVHFYRGGATGWEQWTNGSVPVVSQGKVDVFGVNNNGVLGTGTPTKYYLAGIPYASTGGSMADTVATANTQPVTVGGMNQHNVVFIWSRELTDAEHASLAANPWQIFMPEGKSEEYLFSTDNRVGFPGDYMRPMRHQPQGLLKIHKGNSLTNNLRSAVLPGVNRTLDPVSGKNMSFSGLTSVTTPAGLAAGFGPTLGTGNSTDILNTGFSGAFPSSGRTYYFRALRNGAGPSGLGRLFDKTNGTTGQFLYWYQGGTSLGYSFYAGGSERFVGIPNVAALGTWFDVLITHTFDGSTHTVNAWANGVLAVNNFTITASNDDAPTTQFSIGNRASDSIRSWDGLIECAYIWDGVQSSMLPRLRANRYQIFVDSSDGDELITPTLTTPPATNVYILIADPASTSLTMQNNSLLANRKVFASNASFGLSYVPSFLNRGYNISASYSGGILLNASSTKLVSARKVSAQVSTQFNIGSIPAKVLSSRKITAQASNQLGISSGLAKLLSNRLIFIQVSAPFTISNGVTKLLNNKLVSAQASTPFMISSNNTKLLNGKRIAAQGTGPFTLSGVTTNLLSKRMIGAQVASSTLSGSNTNLLNNKLVKAQTGSSSLSGFNTNLLNNKLVKAMTGSSSLSGFSTKLLNNKLVKIQTGSTLVSGYNTNLLNNKLVKAQSGSSAVSGFNANLLNNKLVKAQNGASTISGTSSGLRASRKISMTSGSMPLVGNPASLLLSALGVFSVASGTFSVSSNITNLTVSRKLASGGSSYTLSSASGKLIASRKLPSVPTAYIVGNPAGGLIAARKVSVITSNYNVIGNTLLVRVMRRLQLAADNFAVNGTVLGLRALFKLRAYGNELGIIGNNAYTLVSRKFRALVGGFVYTQISSDFKITRNADSSHGDKKWVKRFKNMFRSL